MALSNVIAFVASPHLARSAEHVPAIFAIGGFQGINRGHSSVVLILRGAAMIGITLGSEQILRAPTEVRRWIEHEVTASLGLQPCESMVCKFPITHSESVDLGGRTRSLLQLPSLEHLQRICGTDGLFRSWE
jgi:hypothetical protein